MSVCLSNFSRQEYLLEVEKEIIMKSKRFITIVIAVVIIAFISSDMAIPAGNNSRIPVFIGFRRTPGPSEQALVRSHGGAIKYSYNIVPAIAASVPQQAIQGLMNNPNVTYVESDAVAYAIDDAIPWGISRIGALTVQSSSNTGSDIKVGVIDTGIDYTHPDLIANYAGGTDYVNNDNDPYDDNGHGTHVSGTIAAVWNNIGVRGVAPDADLYAVKVLNARGSGSYSDIVAGINWCASHGIQVINMSLGGSFDSTTLRNACNNAYENNIVIVAAAGNSGRPNGSGDTVGYPAKYDSVIAVAATNSSDLRASWSSTGPAVEISAPGVNVLSTVPGGYAYYNGTSMASPHVAGTAALVIAANKKLSNVAVRDILDGTALDLGPAGRDYYYGWGLVNAVLAVDAAKKTNLETPQEGTVSASISYSGSGGRNHDKNLSITVSLIDDLGNPVSGASVSIDVELDDSYYASGTGTTGTNGAVAFIISNAPSGTYTTTITAVNADGLTWDGITPSNSFTKSSTNSKRK